MPDGDTIPDQQLLERFRAGGDEAALVEIIDRHAPMVLGVCRRTAPRWCVEDAFQATFVVLLEKFDSIREADIAPWLYRVAVRVCLQARRERAALLPWPEDGCEPASECEAFREIEIRETQTIVEEEISRLPSRLRTPLVLFHMRGKSRSEIAKLLRCSVTAVKSRLDRARRRLRERLVRRGVAVTAVATALTLTTRTTTVAAELLQGVQHTANLWRAGETIDSSVLNLSDSVIKEVTQTMMTLKYSKLALIGSVVGVVALLAGLNLHHLFAAPPGTGNSGPLRINARLAESAIDAVPAPVAISANVEPPQAPATSAGVQPPLGTEPGAHAALGEPGRLPTGNWTRSLGPYTTWVYFEGNTIRVFVEIEEATIQLDGECSATQDGIVYGVIQGVEFDGIGDEELETVVDLAGSLTEQPFSFRFRQVEDRLYVKDAKCAMLGDPESVKSMLKLAVGVYHPADELNRR